MHTAAAQLNLLCYYRRSSLPLLPPVIGVCAALWDLIKTLLRFCRFARVVRPAAREIPLLIQEKLNKRTRDLAVIER